MNRGNGFAACLHLGKFCEFSTTLKVHTHNLPVLAAVRKRETENREERRQVTMNLVPVLHVLHYTTLLSKAMRTPLLRCIIKGAISLIASDDVNWRINLLLKCVGHKC